MSNSLPKLHNAMWPGLVGKEPGTDNPPISLDRMLELTAGAEVNGQKFEGIDYFLFHPHTDPDASLAFYRDVLGFEVRLDVGYEDMRWITVGPAGQPDTAIVLHPPAATPACPTTSAARSPRSSPRAATSA